MEHTKLKIGVIHIYNFPYGLAPTTRITAYCKGLISNGHHVDIFSLSPQEKNSTYPLQGICEGGQYFHFSRVPKYKIPLLTGWVLMIYNIIRILHYIKLSHRVNKYDAFILSFDEPYQLGIFGRYLKKNQGAKIIAIADEYPIPIRKYLKDSIPKRKILKYKYVYRNINARILMTQKLQDFYDKLIVTKPTLLLSTIVDVDRFEEVSRSASDHKYLCYMGNMELSKDNVDNIILAFNIVKDKYPNLELHLYGTPNKDALIYLTSIINESNLENRVYLKGRASYQDVPRILSNATILVSSQPNTKRAEGGFPTKLGEYFMTGVPTLLTDVGEISLYAKHMKNAYLVPPSDPHEYARAIDYIIEHYDDALIVAHRAKEYIYNKFSYHAAGKDIENFIYHLFAES